MSRIRRLFETHGVVGSCRIMLAYAGHSYRSWRDGELDRTFGLDTRGIIEPEELEVIGDNGARSTGHEPIQLSIFARMMRDVSINAKAATFVDFGSGKGRAVILAARFGFQRIIGVEFAPRLHRIAQDNVNRYVRQAEVAPGIELHCMDAIDFQPPDDPLVCLFYNPFDGELLTRVLNNLRDSFERAPRPIWVLYRNPLWSAVVEECGFLSVRVAKPGYRIYCAQAPGTSKP